MSWEIKAKNKNSYKKQAESYEKVDDITLYPNCSSVIEDGDETVLVLYQDKLTENPDPIIGLSACAKKQAEEMIKSKTVNFGMDAHYVIEGLGAQIACTIQKTEPSKLELICQPGQKVKVNGQEIADFISLNPNDSIEICNINESVASFDELVIKAINAYIYQRYAKGKDAGLSMATVRANNEGKISITYPKNDLIYIYGLDKRNNIRILNEDGEPEHLGEKPKINVVKKEVNLSKFPALFMCTKDYKDFMDKELENQVIQILSTYKNAYMEEDLTLKDVVDQAVGPGGFGKAITVSRRGDDREYSLACLMSYKEDTETPIAFWKNKLSNPVVKWVTLGTGVAFLGIITTLLGAGYMKRRAAKKDSEPKAIALQTPMKEPESPSAQISEHPDTSVQTITPEDEKSQEKQDLPAIQTKIAKTPDTKPEKEPEPKQEEGITGEVFVEIEPETPTTEKSEPEVSIFEEIETKDYSKMLQSQIEKAEGILTGVTYKTLLEKPDYLKDAQTTIESTESLLKDKKEEIENSSELEKNLASVKSMFEKKSSYIKLIKKTKNPETKDSANADLARLCFNEDKYNLAWQFIQQLPEEKRSELGIIHQIYQLEQRLAEGIPKGLTEKIIAETKEKIQTENYQQAKDVLEQLSKYGVDTKPAVMLIKDLDVLSKELKDLPSNTIEAKVRRNLALNRKQRINSIFSETSKVLQKKETDIRLLKLLGDLYTKTNKIGKAEELYKKYRDIQGRYYKISEGFNG